MKNLFFKSLIWKISGFVLLIEITIMASIGFYYTKQFSYEIDKRIESMIKIPGILMNHQLLIYKAVTDKHIMTELLGEEFLDGIVFGADKKAFYALNNDHTGKSMSDIPGIDAGWIDKNMTIEKTIRISEGQDSYLVSITPLVAYEGDKPYSYVYIKVNTNRSEAEKRSIANFFILGFLICVVLTSLFIIGFMQLVIIRPIRELEKNAAQLSQGNLEKKIKLKRDDELGSLANSFEYMRENISQKIRQLEELTRTPEEKVPNRTKDLGERVKELNCLYGISSLIEKPKITLKEILQGAVDLIPPSWQYPAVTSAKVIIDDQEFRTANYKETAWEQSANIIIQGEKIGILKVCYLEEKPDRDEGPFLKEERSLIYAIAVQLGRIIEYKRAETALREAKIAADSANQAKSDFLANMSHELRTPLNVILGFTQIISKDKTVSAGHHEQMNIIKKSGEVLLELINQLLNFSKIEAGHVSFDENEFDFYRLLDELKKMFYPLAAEKGLEMLFECSPDVPAGILADEMKLRQVLTNLMENAVKFTETGSVSLRVNKTEADENSLSSQIYLHFTIEDTGPGIRPDETDQLFNAFTQTESGKRSEQGTGLGLAISQKFVQLMGDTITVSSRPGSGTTFSFSIPVSESARSAVDEKEPYDPVESLESAKTARELGQAKQLASIKALPARLVSELKEAATYCETEVISRIITDIRKQDSNLADKLDRLAGQFDFDGILALLGEDT